MGTSTHEFQVTWQHQKRDGTTDVVETGPFVSFDHIREWHAKFGPTVTDFKITGVAVREVTRYIRLADTLLEGLNL